MKQKCPRCKGCATSRPIGAFRYIYCDFCDKYFRVDLGGYTEVDESDLVERIIDNVESDRKTEDNND
jgi:hypothetical protein